jgi:hypothetical protein
VAITNVPTADGNSAIAFTTIDSYSYAERMRITSGGNVGIGTSSPNNYAGYTTLTLDGSSGSEIDFEQGGTLSADMFVNTSAFYVRSITAIPLVFSTQATERMRITSGGNVLIGTATNGASKLRISGLPTSAVGLSSGDVYNLAGVLMIA